MASGYFKQVALAISVSGDPTEELIGSACAVVGFIITKIVRIVSPHPEQGLASIGPFVLAKIFPPSCAGSISADDCPLQTAQILQSNL
jgi:hypothetical protein